jgi:hypothetical protein
MSRSKPIDPARRRALTRLIVAGSLAPLTLLRPGRSDAAELPLLDPSSPAARKLEYVPDASKAQAIAKGNRCAGCGLYQGAYGSKQGPCQLFPGKDVLASGWCSSWQPQM